MVSIADLVSRITGSEYLHANVADAEWKDTLMAAGVLKPYAVMLLCSSRAARQGDFVLSDPTWGRLLGRDPAPIEKIQASAFA